MGHNRRTHKEVILILQRGYCKIITLDDGAAPSLYGIRKMHRICNFLPSVPYDKKDQYISPCIFRSIIYQY